jgi:hypothetical protein
MYEVSTMLVSRARAAIYVPNNEIAKKDQSILWLCFRVGVFVQTPPACSASCGPHCPAKSGEFSPAIIQSVAYLVGLFDACLSGLGSTGLNTRFICPGHETMSSATVNGLLRKHMLRTNLQSMRQIHSNACKSGRD